MINAIKIAGLRNNDYSQFLQNFLSVIDRYDPAALLVKAEYDELKTISDELKTLLNEGTANAITDELIKFDTLRDDCINGILSTVNAATYSQKEDIKTAGKLLSMHLAGFGPALARESYQNETSKIQKIIADWTTKPELAAAVTLLGLDGWKKELETANTVFDKRYVDRSVETGTLNADKVYDKRPEGNAAYYELREQLNAWYTVKKKAEPFATAVAALNGVINDYNILISRRPLLTNTDTVPVTEAVPVL